jgi:uncharacterized membrane protein YraQ (UPF0718 family)
MEGVLVVVGMFLLRLGVPLAITLAVGYWLRRLDARWEAEAQAQWEQEEAPAELKALKTTEQPCWETKGCDEASRAQCPACKLWDIPCWVARLRATGRLPTECFNCELFSFKPAGSPAV